MANEPLAYRDAIAGVLEDLMPQAEVMITDPLSLDEEVGAVRPGLVVCSFATATVKGVRCWIELYPGHGHDSVVSVGGRRRVLSRMELPDVILVAEQAEKLALVSVVPAVPGAPTAGV